MLARAVLASLTFTVLAAGTAEAQLGKLKEKVKQRAEAAVDRATDKTLDKAENKVRCAVGDDECVADARKAGKPVEMVNEDGDVVPQAKAAGAKSGSAKQAGAPSESASKVAALKPGEGAWSNYDFVPGERVLFAEDFTKDRVGNFPRRLDLISGNAEVVDWNGGRWLKFESDGWDGFTINLPEALPQRFTIEMEALIPWNDFTIIPSATVPTQSFDYTRIELGGSETGVFRARSNEGSAVDPRTVFKDMHCDDCLTSRPFKIRVHVDGKYVKLYLDERRVSNIPNADFERANKIHFMVTGTSINGTQQPFFLKSISINAGGRELYDALMADGRVATQGIYFDTGSDRIRPESSGTLKEIADMLKEHADLKLTIEGHTDNVGQPGANQTLSEKRAAAVKAALTATYGVEASRLGSKGLGDTKPVGKNDTAEGRQQNRRVELVKM